MDYEDAGNGVVKRKRRGGARERERFEGQLDESEAKGRGEKKS